ncbi:protein of unknown function [Taphrina deformans PYCC 5710]|uniref:Glycerophosphocholine phosphodiesterase Gde1 n=1 Tax=Taphrina deformans (strain PYCC 5710 / ATCC 11124 / CBS 356.35 / IMI 108563 / JCM 9778 / NBRC 8474) TaxID=1097556 RepID=R4XIG6_TAPDE|nr:protein of unknown function [Taphrina deformans PYCC 5710]|eukprot:CCG84294.1 protein of unknown function [Taphrina deformans PYCC 5710]
MKFGKNLENNKVPEFSSHYIDYKGLKKVIKQIRHVEPPDGAGRQDEFMRQLDENVTDIDNFYNVRSADVTKRLRMLESRYHIGPESELLRLDLPSDEWEELVTAMLDLRASLQKLLWFAEVNKQGIIKILKKLEKKTDVVAKIAYLSTRVEPLHFASPIDIAENLKMVNRWLSKIVPADIANLSVSTSPTLDNMRRVRSIVHMGLQESTANTFEQLIQEDKGVELQELLISQVTSSNKILANLLQQALLKHSLRSAAVLLANLESLISDDDINERNVLHKLIIVQGRRICTTKDGRHGSPLAEEMWITPALPPPPDISLGNPAIDFGVRTRDDVSEDDPKALKFLLDHMSTSLRPFLNQRDAQKRLPLHYAAEYGLEKCAQVICSYMLRWGYLKETDRLESSKFGDINGYSPVHLCIKYRYPITLNVLLRALNDDNSEVYEIRKHSSMDARTLNPLSLAVGSPEIIRILIDAGMDVNFQDNQGETCLHVAARRGEVTSVTEILEHNNLQKANLQLAEKVYGWTPVFVAAVEGHLETVEILAKACNNLDQVDLSGWTAMEHAAFRGHIKCGKLLRPECPPGPKSTFDRVSQRKPFTNSASTAEALAKAAAAKLEKESAAGVKTFGHRYLKDRCMIIVTLGSTDARRQSSPIQLDRVPIAEAGTTRLDTALSLIVSAKNAEGDSSTFDLPLGDSPTTDPMLFTAKDPSKTQLLFDIVPTYAAAGTKTLGRAVALLSSIKTKVGAQKASLWGAVTVPIVEAETLGVIGTLEFEFSIVTPFSHVQMAVEKESTYWKSLMTTRVIGHRGLGKNTNVPDRRSLQLGENTVQSFVAAANLGASYVEFDVQITKDLVPVIYHDFLVSQTGIDAPVHALTLDQFMSASGHPEEIANGPRSDRIDPPERRPGRSRSMSSKELFDNMSRMKNTRDFKMHGFKGNQRGHSVQDAFTTLAEVFKKVPQTVGFNIECKYPMLSEAEDEEMDHTAIEINQWVDTVLKCVYDHADGRDIIFSSFHPDICLLLSLKQPAIPCLFLTEAGTSYMCDIRAGSLQEAIRFASRWNLLGLVSACEPFILCPRLVRVVKESGLVCVSYGVMNNMPEHVNAQVTAGVDAVIVDSVLAIRKGLTTEGTTHNSEGVSEAGQAHKPHELVSEVF